MSLSGYKKKHKPALWTHMRQAPVKVAAPSRLNHISASRRQRLREYVKAKREYIAARPAPKLCEACESLGRDPRKASQIHHVRGRLGKLLAEKLFFKHVCQHCHEFIHANPVIAREHGLLAKPGEWNKQL